jgi:hypothetical protein
VQAEQPSRQNRCLGYGLINVGRRGRGYGEREAAQSPLPRRVLAGWRGRLVAQRGDRIAFSRATGSRSAPGPSRVAIDVANAGGGLADEIDAAGAEAVKGLRAYGYSWAEIGPRLGITRQAAQQRWGITSRAQPRHT